MDANQRKRARLVDHWKNLATSDFETAIYLFQGAKYPQCIYMLCQSIEKLLKANLVASRNEAVPKMHRLDSLAKKTT